MKPKLHLLSGKGIDKAVGGDVDDLAVDVSGESLNGVIGAECHIEAIKNLMKRVVHIFGVDALHLFIVLAIEVWLN